MPATVIAVCQSPTHSMRKASQESITLLTGLGVEGDAHAGTTVKHRSRVRVTPDAPNLRQVHLIHAELLDELREKGFVIEAGRLGENITTCGIDLLGLPTGARLHIGPSAILEITGLRNPCVQIDRIQPGLLAAVLDRDEHGEIVRKAGVMSIVLEGGPVSPGDSIRIALPPLPHVPLKVV